LQAYRLLLADLEYVYVLLLQVKHPFWPVVELALRTITNLAYHEETLCEALGTQPGIEKLDGVFGCLSHEQLRVVSCASRVLQARS
jgi:hypothetical protein